MSPGTYAAAPASSICKQCAPRTFNPVAAASTCLACSQGEDFLAAIKFSALTIDLNVQQVGQAGLVPFSALLAARYRTHFLRFAIRRPTISLSSPLWLLHADFLLLSCAGHVYQLECLGLHALPLWSSLLCWRFSLLQLPRVSFSLRSLRVLIISNQSRF